MESQELSIDKFSIKEVIQKSVDIIKDNFVFCLLFALIWIGLPIILSTLVGGISKTNDPTKSTANLCLFGFCYLWGFIFIQGIYKIILDLTKTGKSSLEKLIPKDFNLTIKMAFAAFIYGVICVIGLVCLIIPGIYLAIRLQFSPFLIAEKNYEVIESFKKSWQMTEGYVFKLFLLFLAFLGIALVVFFPLTIVLTACLVGVMVLKSFGLITFILIGLIQGAIQGLLTVFGMLATSEIYTKLV